MAQAKTKLIQYSGHSSDGVIVPEFSETTVIEPNVPVRMPVAVANKLLVTEDWSEANSEQSDADASGKDDK